MKKEELILKTKQKLEEIQAKIKDFKEKAEQNTDDAIQEKNINILNELEELGEKIQKQYSTLGFPENQRKPHITEMEKNIYNNLESFDSAFRQAGSIFKTH